jgi:hypothetical protein
MSRPTPMRTLPSGRGSLTALFVVLLLSLMPLAAARAAAAQVAEAWMHATPIEALGTWQSARLTAMGGLTVSAEDRFSRLNAYEYGMNPAGLLGLRDTSWAEQGSEYQSFQDGYYGENHSAISRKSGLRGAVQRERWALGLDFIYAAVNASRHDLIGTPDNSRFIRDFDIPFATSFLPVTGDRTIGARVVYPGVALTYARRPFSWITLGGRFGFREETEDRRVADPYDLDNDARATEYTAGAVIQPPHIGNVVRLAGFGQYVKNRVIARSESPLNDDTFDWERPTVAYGGELLIGSGRIRGIVDGRHRSYDGEQVAQVNWAPQFFMNPFPSTTDPRFVFKKRWSSFLSGYRHNEASTRWMADLPWLPAHFGAEWGYYREYEWIRPNPDVLQLALPLDVRRLGYRAAGGLSLDLPDGDGQIAFEVHATRDYRNDFLRIVPDIVATERSYHLGAEYRVLRWLPVRAGAALLRTDPDKRDGIAPYKGIRASFGAGVYWPALGAQIDAAYAHEHFHHAPLDPSLEIGSGDQAVLTISRLF